MTLPDTDLAAFEALEKAATHGPWKAMSDTLEIYKFHDATGIDAEPHSTKIGSVEFDRARSGTEAIANALFIAAARTHAPALVAEVRGLRIDVEANRETYRLLNEQRLAAIGANQIADDRIATLESERDRLVKALERLDAIVDAQTDQYRPGTDGYNAGFRAAAYALRGEIRTALTSPKGET